MSSAALQAAPHQSSTVASLSPTASPQSRQYNTSQSSQPRDPYYNQQQNSNVSPISTSRRPSRRPSGNGASSSTQPPSAYYPTESAPNSSPMPSRLAHTSSETSPVSTVTSSTYPATSPTEYQRGMPPIAPPRTSSNQRTSAAAVVGAPAVDRSRRATQPVDDRSQNSARTGPSGDSDGQHDRETEGGNNRQTNGNDRDRGKDDAAATASAASRSRRRAQQEPQEAPQQRSGSSREQRSAGQSRSQGINHSSTASPNGPSREPSEILNRVVISKPEVDIDRERERMAEAVPHSSTGASDVVPVTGLSVVGSEGVEDGGRGGQRSRHDYTANSSKREKNVKFGEYYLGNTLGEGEFGKVKMGWKQEGGVQVAIKLIRRDSVGGNPTRLAKIYREIAILREISHPNIVRLHEMVETEKHIGIILEYASGGELFDYILNHRYLKDAAARRLFAQLVSGVGYLHKKGIVHRDLKLENLLLDRNRNIIITDFGFANTFNPADELGEEVEYGLSSRDYVKRMELDKILPGGFRRGDLMQTSCGSPCYAAPELVVSDSLYTGRKVDVWSCGVILYAMLAGYLPFDDDPANPEGDNINLLYKYIVSTPLTFPEYVTPHARDLLRRILVADPRKRADLFEVARHSWLSEFAHVVGFITSSTSTTGEISNATVGAVDHAEVPLLARSASVREPTKTQKTEKTAVGDLARKHGTVDSEETHQKTNKDNKRRTVQVEYVAPRSQTVRGEDAPATGAASSSRTRARAGSQGPVEVNPQTSQPVNRRAVSTEKPLPLEPPPRSQDRRPSTSQRQTNMPPPSRPGREPPRSVSDNAFMQPLIGGSIARPNTGGSLTSTASGRGSGIGLPNRGSYGQPVAPTVAGTNVHGRMAQPQGAKGYAISSPMSQGEGSEYGRLSVSQVPPKFAKLAGFQDGTQVPEPTQPKGHKRSNTVSGLGEKLFGRRGSFFGGKATPVNQEKPVEKSKKYPPVSMSGANIEQSVPRPSMDSSRRSISFGFGRKRSGSISGSAAGSDKPRRFSLLPASFSLKAIGIGKDFGTPGAPPSDGQDFYDDHDSNTDYVEPSGRGQTRVPSAGQAEAGHYNQHQAQHRNSPQQDYTPNATPPHHQRYASQSQPYNGQQGPTNIQQMPRQYRTQEPAPTDSEASLNYQNRAVSQSQAAARYPQGFSDYDSEERRQPAARTGHGVLQKNNRKFTDAYEQEQDQAYGGNHNSSGSSGAARKVMDFFRRRGKAREDGDR